MKARHAVVRLTILMEICKLYVLRNREEKSLRHVAMVAKFLDLNKPCSCKYGGRVDIFADEPRSDNRGETNTLSC